MFEDDQSKGENENENDEKNNFLDLFSHICFIIIIINSFLLLDRCHMVKDDQSKHEAEDEDDDKKTKWRKRFHTFLMRAIIIYDSIATVGEIRVYRRADFQSGSRVLKKVF